jgi:hypothetical protein
MLHKSNHRENLKSEVHTPQKFIALTYQKKNLLHFPFLQIHHMTHKEMLKESQLLGRKSLIYRLFEFGCLDKGMKAHRTSVSLIPKEL